MIGRCPHLRAGNGPVFSALAAHCLVADGRTFSTSARRRPRLGIGYGTAASRSGRITTLSCSFGSVPAPTATAGVVRLRLTATCGAPAGM